MLDRRQFIGASTLALMAPVAGLAAGRPAVTVTTGMIADAVRAIGGEDIDLVQLMGPGVDPHGYRPTRNDIATLSRSDLILWNGLYLEAQLEDLLSRLKARASVVAVAEAAPQDQLLAHEDYAGRYDPHLWMVPELWKHAVDAVHGALQTLLPDHGPQLASRHAAYSADIDRVGSYARTVLNSVPPDSRVLVTAHDAFGYFGRAYGFEVIGVQGISTESEAGLDRIRSLVDLIVERDIRAVFVETSVSDRNLRALIEGARAQGHSVEVGGELFSDAMGQVGTYEASYVGMIDHNATRIAASLGGTAPALGMDGRLSAGL